MYRLNQAVRSMQFVFGFLTVVAILEVIAKWAVISDNYFDILHTLPSDLLVNLNLYEFLSSIKCNIANESQYIILIWLSFTSCLGLLAKFFTLPVSSWTSNHCFKFAAQKYIQTWIWKFGFALNGAGLYKSSCSDPHAGVLIRLSVPFLPYSLGTFCFQSTPQLVHLCL